MEYDMVHCPPGPKQFTNHLRQVVWPRGFKLEKLNHYGSNFTRPLADLLWVTSTSWPITFLWWLARWGTNDLSVSLGIFTYLPSLRGEW
jgi:hypothetical protein